MAAGSVLGWLTALTVCDIRRRRLPNILTVPGAVVMLAAAAVLGRGWPAAAGGAALMALYLVVHLIAPSSLGAGDMKLAAGIGAFTGYFGVDVWLLAALGAPLLSSAWGVASWLSCGTRTVPHGPSMCTASMVAVGLAVL